MVDDAGKKWAGEQPPESRPDRRRSGQNRAASLDSKDLGGIGRDELGNAVWEWRVDVPRRREEDLTIDLLECLDVEGLELDDNEDADDGNASFNPYDRGQRKKTER